MKIFIKSQITALLICLFLLPGLFPAFGQQALPEVLQAVARNNKTLASQRQFLDAQMQSFRTGLTPANPVVDYDYLKGSPAEAGNQTDFSLSQSLDFPTAYARKRMLAQEQSRLAELNFAVRRQEVLLEAQLNQLDLIYHNRALLQVNRRIRQTEKLVADYEKQLKQGNISILDVNKAKLQLIQIRQQARDLAASQDVLRQKLVELNGGIAISIPDTLYPATPALPPFEMLDSLIETHDPIVKTFSQQKTISEKQVSLTKALALPKVETGYHYQAILGQSYQGVHLGVSIPLWENRHTLAAQQAQVNWRESQLQEHRLEHQSANRQLFTRQENLQKSLQDYSRIFTAINNLALLDKALRLGEISTVTYFQERAFFFQSQDTFLDLERDYQLTIARLLKYQL